MTKRLILYLALFTLLVFGAAGAVLLTYSRNQDLLSFINSGKNMLIQIVIGAVFGTITAKAGWSIVQLPFLKKTKKFFVDLIQPLQLNIYEIVFISICAGIGEELLFRGGVQPWLGIWSTAILFVLLHGYLNPFNLPMTVYGMYMTMVIGVLGLMTEHIGIVTAITAHFVIDLILLWHLSHTGSSPNDDRPLISD
jgi:membrane protease YdiL (CAAX protease family)